MTYQQLLSSALVTFGEGDFEGALAGLAGALGEAARIDPEGPRVADVLGYQVAVLREAGREVEAAHAEARRVAIQARFPALEGP